MDTRMFHGSRAATNVKDIPDGSEDQIMSDDDSQEDYVNLSPDSDYNPDTDKENEDPKENIILKQLITRADWGYPLDSYDSRVMVKTYLDSRGKTINKFKDNLRGKNFAYGFLKRHKKKIRTRLCQNSKRSRAAVSPDTINSYFDHLRGELKDIPPTNIVNYDETNLYNTKQECRYPERVCNSSRSCTSIMFAASADDKVLPPYIVYKAQHIKKKAKEGESVSEADFRDEEEEENSYLENVVREEYGESVGTGKMDRSLENQMSMKDSLNQMRMKK
ncbi:hypothetical protein NQ314_001999 [Rhamnusium bicolor]|uniref:Transposase n=1 Tax=Rhamnusium bicolor TaxID=1586634 RepID=A0AAV8ZU52_9CUCU|nr:hypothetical protein NQ314_001999 [Rhamnusium bicolor]